MYSRWTPLEPADTTFPASWGGFRVRALSFNSCPSINRMRLNLDEGEYPPIRPSVGRLPRPASPKPKGRSQDVPHAHHYYELCVCIEGAITLDTSFDRLFLHSGEIVLLSPFLTHTSDVVLDKQRPCAVSWLIVDPPFVGGISYRYQNGTESLLWRIIVRDVRRALLIYKLCDEVLRSDGEARTAYAEACVHLIRQTVLQGDGGHGPSFERADVVHMMKDAICNAYHRPDLTLEWVAETIGFTPSHASRLFEQETHVPFRRYLQEVRLRRAQEMLITTDSSIAEIACAVGIADPYYFSRVFKRHIGIPPSQYRQTFSFLN